MIAIRPKPLSHHIAFWIGLILVVVFLRLPSFTDAFFDPDVAATVYSAQLFSKGSCIYPDAVETKPPGSYAIFTLLLAIAKNMMGVHLLLVVYHLIVAAILSQLITLRCGQAAGWWAALFYSVFSSGCFVNGFAPNFETWALLPLAGASLAIDRMVSSDRIQWPALAGFSAGFSTLMKQQVILVTLGLCLAMAIFSWRYTRRRLPHWKVRTFLPFAVGAILPWAIVLVYFTWKGCLGDLINALDPERGIGYIFSNKPSEISIRAIKSFMAFAWNNWFLLLVAFFGAIVLARRQVSSSAVLLSAWLLGSLGAVFAGTLFWTHYFIFFIPPLAIVGGIGASSIIQLTSRSMAKVLLIGLFVLGLTADQWREATFSLISARSLATQGQIHTRDTFRFNLWLGPSWWSHSLTYNMLEWEIYAREAGKYIQQNSLPNDHILVYDYIPSIYWYSKRFAPSRHHMNWEVAYEFPEDLGRWHDGPSEKLMNNRRELMKDLTVNPPKYIIRCRYDDWSSHKDSAPPVNNIYGDPLSKPMWQTPLFPDLEQFIDSHYQMAKEMPSIPLIIMERDDDSL